MHNGSPRLYLLKSLDGIQKNVGEAVDGFKRSDASPDKTSQQVCLVIKWVSIHVANSWMVWTGKSHEHIDDLFHHQRQIMKIDHFPIKIASL